MMQVAAGIDIKSPARINPGLGKGKKSGRFNGPRPDFNLAGKFLKTRGSGFSLIELVIAFGLLALMMAAFFPCWSAWQRWHQRAVSQMFLRWEHDFMEQRLYSQALLANSVTIDAPGQIKFTYNDQSVRTYGVDGQALFEKFGSKRWLTYAPLLVSEWQPQSSQGILAVRATLSRKSVALPLRIDIAELQ